MTFFGNALPKPLFGNDPSFSFFLISYFPLGNGDVLGYTDYYEHLENHNVDGVMIARGALVSINFAKFMNCYRVFTFLICRSNPGYLKKLNQDAITIFHQRNASRL